MIYVMTASVLGLKLNHVDKRGSRLKIGDTNIKPKSLK